MNATAPIVMRLTPHLSADDCSRPSSAVMVVIEPIPPRVAFTWKDVRVALLLHWLEDAITQGRRASYRRPMLGPLLEKNMRRNAFACSWRPSCPACTQSLGGSLATRRRMR